MKLISIYYQGIEIDYIAETLSLVSDSNIFPDNLKFTASEYPFLIIENEKTESAFGKNDIIFSNPQYYAIEIRTFSAIYEGELQILSYHKGYRKANVRFANKLFGLSTKKLTDIMPSISVTNEMIPTPFTDKYEGIPPNPIHYANYVSNVALGGFPSKLWKAPIVSYPNKYGELNEEDTWYNFKGSLNAVDENGFVLNTIENTSEGLNVISRNVPTWCVYLLTPLNFICARYGLAFPSNLFNDDFASKLAFFSNNNNLTEVSTSNNKIQINYGSVGWSYSAALPPQFDWIKSFLLGIQKPGKYLVKLKFNSSDDILNIGLGFYNKYQQVEYRSFRNQTASFDIEFDFEVTPQDLTNNITLQIYSRNRTDFSEIESFYIEEKLNKSGYMFHPTIDFSRYVPDWTIAEYLNQLRLLLNIRFIEKQNNTVLVAQYIDEEVSKIDYVDLGSLYISDYDQNEVTQLRYKFDNDIDKPHVLSATGVVIENAGNKEKLFESKFKQIGLPLTKEIEDKNGFGLVLLSPDTNDLLESVNDISVNPESIFNRYFSKSAIKYLNPNRITINHRVTLLVLNEIEEKRRVLINKKPYYVESITKESTTNLIDIKLELMPL